MSKRRGPGEGSIFQRGDGRWVASLSLPSVGGKRQRRTVYGATYEEVRDKARDVRKLLDLGVTPSAGLRVDQFLERWLNDTVPGQVSAKTAHEYRRVVRLYLTPPLGQRRLGRLTIGDCNATWDGMRQRGLSANTIRYARTVLRKALRHAEIEGLVPRNVATLSNPPRLGRSEGRSLTAEQARAFLEAARGERLEACYQLMLAYGLRRGEALGLTWADLDEEAGTLAVRQGVKREPVAPDPDGSYPGGRHNRVVISDLKTARSRRTLYLTPHLVDSLRAHKARQASERMGLGPGWTDLGLMFPSCVGTPMDPDNFAGALSKLTTKAGLGHWNPHALRHSGASLMLAQGTPLHVVSEVLGHSSISVTANVYAHLFEGQKRDAAEVMTAALFTPRVASLGT
jgi:integrase